MKTNLIISFLFLFSIISCKKQAEEVIETHIQKLNMHGKIKSIHEISYAALTKEGKIVKGEENRDFYEDNEFTWNKDFVMNLDTVGRITDYTFYYYDKEIFKKDTCEYYSPKGIDSDPAWKISFLYKNTSDKLVEISNETQSTYHYDKLGNLTLIDWGDLEKTKFKYDNKKNLVEEKHYDENGELSRNKKYTYKYDSQGNWIEKIVYNEEKPEFIISRTISYYK